MTVIDDVDKLTKEELVDVLCENTLMGGETADMRKRIRLGFDCMSRTDLLEYASGKTLYKTETWLKFPKTPVKRKPYVAPAKDLPKVNEEWSDQNHDAITAITFLDGVEKVVLIADHMLGVVATDEGKKKVDRVLKKLKWEGEIVYAKAL